MTVMATTPQTAQRIDTDLRTEIEYIGLEFEYPVAENPAAVPATRGLESYPLRHEIGTGNSWNIGDPDIPVGDMTSDHVGAEITSAPMALHTTQPEVWYRKTAALATEMGYPFAATGSGETTFGLHFNLSPLPRDKAEALADMITEPWARVFFCASVDENGADPWRHGGANIRDLEGNRTLGDTQYWTINEPDDSEISYDSSVGSYYEFRLPEPGLPNHVNLMVRFIRILDTEGPEAAREFARELVYEASPLLTPVQQYRHYREDEEWFESAFDDTNINDPTIAEFMGEIMGDT